MASGIRYVQVRLDPADKDELDEILLALRENQQEYLERVVRQSVQIYKQRQAFQSTALDPASLTGEELSVLEALLAMIRDPRDLAEKSLPDLIRGLTQSRTKKIG